VYSPYIKRHSTATLFVASSPYIKRSNQYTAILLLFEMF
jgi:hypothetical protein